MWSLTLMLLAADTGLLRIFTLGIYPNDPRMIWIGLAELVVMVAAAAVVAPDVRRLSTPGSRGVAGAEDRARPLRAAFRRLVRGR
jgi:hypothetical protein